MKISHKQKIQVSDLFFQQFQIEASRCLLFLKESRSLLSRTERAERSEDAHLLSQDWGCVLFPACAEKPVRSL